MLLLSFSIPLSFAILALALTSAVGSPLTPAAELKDDLVLQQRHKAAKSLVDKVNVEQSLWKAAVHPRLSLLDQSTLKGMMGLLSDERAEKLYAERMMPSAFGAASPDDEDADLPSHFDAREGFFECIDVIGKIQDQSKCGSCWAVSSASVMSDRICIHSKGVTKVEVSARQITGCAWGFGCHGGFPFFAFGYWKNHGVVSGGDFEEQSGCQPYPFPPHTHKSQQQSAVGMYETPKCEQVCQANYTATEFAKDKHFGTGRKWWLWAKEAKIRREIFENGPVVAGFVVYEDFLTYSEGIYKHVAGTKLGAHAVRLIGWGEQEQKDGSVVKYWLVANSWNKDWGEEGTFRILRGENECGIEKMGITFGRPDFGRK